MSRERRRRREEGQKSSKREICLNQCHSLKVEYIYTLDTVVKSVFS